MDVDRELDDRLGSLRFEAPSSEMLDRIRRSLSAPRPVRPLPSDAALILAACIVFAALAFGEAASTGFDGFQLLSMGRKLLLYGTIGVGALLLATGAVGQMIPGARSRLPAWLTLWLPIGILATACVILFPQFTMSRFVAHGWPCLRLGTLCAIPAGLLTWLLMRRGFLSNPASAATVAGGFAAWVGVAALALHCPIQNAGHILVWHLGVVAIGTACGALVGRMLIMRAARNS